ncbi:uncharacterized protein LOC132035068 [Lycium ferocissimum]|uniref:uncharacterized protein LOC132035068 n=1 Tax=Lycium ferocissimum TaxID=112874 RepID=UPI002814ACD4|nr:uncharacterized protein LOC132035068 [Lycium ferocissimum]
MIQHPDNRYIDPIKVEIRDQPAHCAFVEAETDGKSWYVDIKMFLEKGEYPEGITINQKKSIRKLMNKMPQVSNHGDLIKVPPTELNAMTSPWPFAAWDMDVIGPIEPTASNKHRFILVGIDYFTKWVEATSYASVTKKVVTDFVRNNAICRFGIPELIITDNGANLNSHLMKEMCAQFRITRRNSTAYRPQMNGAMEAANKNVKKILRKMIDNYKDWHEQLPYALLGYRTTTRTHLGLLHTVGVWRTVIPLEVEIPSLRIIQEAELECYTS